MRRLAQLALGGLLLALVFAGLALGQARPPDAADSTAAHLAGTETFTGAKTFSAATTLAATSATTGAFSGTVTSSVASGSNAYVSATGGRWYGGTGYWYMDGIGGGRWIDSVGLYITGSSQLNGGLVNGGTWVTTPGTLSIADNGGGTAAAGTVSATTTSAMQVTCSDTDGCTVTMSETSAVDGQRMVVVNVSANTVTMADTSGVSETAGSAALGQWDSITYVYATDRWVETSRSNN